VGKGGHAATQGNLEILRAKTPCVCGGKRGMIGGKCTGGRAIETGSHPEGSRRRRPVAFPGLDQQAQSPKGSEKADGNLCLEISPGGDWPIWCRGGTARCNCIPHKKEKPIRETGSADVSKQRLETKTGRPSHITS